MKILIELPTWLGDTVMATPAIENLANFTKNPKIILVGSASSIEALKNHPKVIECHVLDKNYYNLYKSIKSFGGLDLFLTFRSSFRSNVLKFCISSKNKYQFDKKKYINGHQVEKFNNFVNDSLKINTRPGKLILHVNNTLKNGTNKLLGINPGASYGNAKRWYPEEFAKVASGLSNSYDILIFGSEGEKEIASDIEECLIEKGIFNYRNLAGQTTIKELIALISHLDLFITGDSGPMHLASVFQIPTVAIFGPTIEKETSQWMNEKSLIVKKDLVCQPCMKRECPLKHHDCMKLIKAADVMKALKGLY
jgi:heptosyltransferase II